VTEILEGLGRAERDQIEKLHDAGRFFWIDVPLSQASAADLAETLHVSERLCQILLGFGEDFRSSRKFRAENEGVVFPFSCYLESAQLGVESDYRVSPIEVHVLVSGDCLLTVHQEQISLPALLQPFGTEGQSEEHLVYAVLDAMVASAFDALTEVELKLDAMSVSSTELGSGRVRTATLKSLSARLSRMRRRLGPQRGLFERIGVELRHIEGLQFEDERYFDRIGGQVNRLVDAIDAAVDEMANLINLRLNETSYLLTVVATIFLPLTFITGFFGMNFGWLVRGIDTQLAFWLLGIGSPLLGVALIWWLIVRAAPVQTDATRLPGRRSS
jgi:magnesium transporter